MAYDPDRLQLFQSILGSLRSLPARPIVHSRAQSVEAFLNCAFFDTYFSNYIEGTKFKVEEAQEIVFHGVLPAARPKDAHDVLGTYRVVGGRDYMERSVVDDEPDAFLARL